MDFRNYSVADELHNISLKVDKLTETELSDIAIDDFFVEARKNMSLIVNGGYTRDHVEETTSRPNSRTDDLLERFIRCRSRVHDNCNKNKKTDDDDDTFYSANPSSSSVESEKCTGSDSNLALSSDTDKGSCKQSPDHSKSNIPSKSCIDVQKTKILESAECKKMISKERSVNSISSGEFLQLKKNNLTVDMRTRNLSDEAYVKDETSFDNFELGKCHVSADSIKTKEETLHSERSSYSGSTILLSSSDTEEHFSVVKSESDYTKVQSPLLGSQLTEKKNEEKKQFQNERSITAVPSNELLRNNYSMQMTPDARIQSFDRCKTYKVDELLKLTKDKGVLLPSTDVPHNTPPARPMVKYFKKNKTYNQFEKKKNQKWKQFKNERSTTAVPSNELTKRNYSLRMTPKTEIQSLEPCKTYKVDKSIKHTKNTDTFLSPADVLHNTPPARPIVKYCNKKGISSDESHAESDKRTNNIKSIFHQTYNISSTSSEENSENSITYAAREYVLPNCLNYQNKIRNNNKARENSNIEKGLKAVQEIHPNYFYNQKRYMHIKSMNSKNSDKHKSSTDTSSEGSMFDSDKCAENSKMRKNQTYEDKDVSSSKDARRKVTEKKIIPTKRHVRKHFQTASAQAIRIIPKKRNFRTATPVEFTSNVKRESLKDKAEAKRKQREIRERKTKERRECLERERKEKTELRLKQRFQQHEEMLKQKRGKYEAKAQKRHWQSYMKSSLSSTSSKDSKEDKEKKIDDFCRNDEEGGQKMYKESNVYPDVSPKKPVLDSVGGMAGLNPGISEKHNSVLVGRDKTPVEFSASSDVMWSNKVIDTGACNHSTPAKYAERFDAEEQDFALPKRANNEAKNTPVDLSNEKFPKTNIDAPMKVHSSELKTVIDLPKQPQSKDDLKKKKIYFLRSVKNVGNTDTLVSRKAEKNHNECVENTCEITSNNPKIKKRKFNCSYFKSLIKAKSKNTLNVPSSNKAILKSETTTQVRKNEQPVTDSNKDEANKEVFLKKTANNKQELKSYKISDMHENSFDESQVDPEKIPLWATGVYIKQALIDQYYNPPDLEEIFGVISDEPVDLAAIFQLDKPQYHRRTSSEHWTATPT